VLLSRWCREKGLACAVVPEWKLGETPVSSTHIRSLLEAGKLEEAEAFLGHPHILSGSVVTGRQLGRTLGIPTANLLPPEDAVQLPHGVYCCSAVVNGETYMAVTNIGNRPTVGGHRITVEPWLLDFDGDLYGQELTLHFYRFLRAEQKFPSLDALKAEIMKNAAETRKFFENNTK
jgi:riboflavin kinase/FMN adenylyltransferase